MEVIIDQKKFFSILGLPRSGTTILNTFFDSMDNGFSISEPIMTINLGKNAPLGKIDHFEYKSKLEFIEKLRIYLFNSSIYNLGGFKETIWVHRRELKFIMNDKLIDFYIFIFREPKANYASWKRFHSELFLSYFVESYHLLHDLYKKNINKSIAFKYEDFCKDSIELINSRQNIFRIKGDINLQPNRDYIHGDKKALTSKKIVAPNFTYDDILHSSEIRIIEKELSFLYSEL